MPETTEKPIEPNPHNPADPVPGEPEKRPELVPGEPADLPPRDPAMTAEEWESIEERHDQAVKDWKAAQKKGHPTTESGSKPATVQKPFTGTTTEDLEPANRKAAAKTAAEDAKATSKEKK